MPFNISSPKKLLNQIGGNGNATTKEKDSTRHKFIFTTTKKDQSTATPTPTQSQPHSHSHPHSKTDNSLSPVSSEYHGHITSPQPIPQNHLQVDNGHSKSSPPQSSQNYRRVTSPLAKPPTTIYEDGYDFGPTSTPSPPIVPPKDFSLPSPVGFLTNSEQSNNNSSSSTDTKSTSLLPKINTISTVNPTSEDSSLYDSNLHRRTLSDRVKTTPSSFVRQSRIFSNDDNESTHSANSLSGRSLLIQNKIQTETLPPEFHPVVTLINAQKLRTYCIGSLQVPGIIGSERVWLEVDAKLTGSELAIWRPSSDEYLLDDGNEFKPKYINVIDCQVELMDDLQVKLYQDFREEAAIVMRLHDKESFNKWMSAIILAKYEYIKLNEAFTAVLLSSKGSKLSDIHVLLNNKKRFPQYDWCNIRLPEVSTKWIKVYMVVLPSDKHHIGRIEFYPSDKKVSRKHLIAFISDLAGIFNVYPEQSNMIDFNSIMRAAGEIYVSKHYEYLFPFVSGGGAAASNDDSLDPRKLIAKNHSISRSGSNNSLSSLSNHTPGTPTNRSRSGSLNSTSSFFNQPASPPPNKDCMPRSPVNPTHTPKSHKRTNSSFFKKHADKFVLTNSVYIMPISHPGVPAIETMVRNFIPIIDAFKLYGRPKRLISDKLDQRSLLFGLPSLPRYQYLSSKDAENAFAKHFTGDLNWFELPEIMANEIKHLQTTNAKGYRGHGDIGRLYENLDLNTDEISSPVINFAVFEDDVPSLNDPIEFGGKLGSPPPRIASPLSLGDEDSPFNSMRNLMV
ncbi:hypothetical protein SBY92_001669 [Candida maltosa Xu316]